MNLSLKYQQVLCNNDNDNENENDKRNNLNRNNRKNQKRTIINRQKNSNNKHPNFVDDSSDNDLNNFLLLIGIKPSLNQPPQKNNEISNNDGENNKNNDECNNPLCDHKTYAENSNLPQLSTITEINYVSDLIEVGKSYHCKKNTTFHGMDLKIMFNLVNPLTKLDNMVGMNSIKQTLVDQILFFLQGHYKKTKCNTCQKCIFNLECTNTQNDMMHTVIAGSPGTGKTELGKLMGEIYKAMGILSKGTFKSVSRSDLIGEYLGHTAVKTQKVIDECSGGVLFIDEAYSLGNSEGRDSFSKECIDTLNRNLSEKRDMLCIIAGYKDQLDRCFFKYNEGLNRRFTFRYEILPYNYKELFEIFEKKVNADEWKLYYNNIDVDKETEKDKILKLFEANISAFPNFGGDIETLLFKCKIFHSRQCVLKNNEMRRVLTYDDIANGMELLKTQRGDDHETIKQKQKEEERKEKEEEKKLDREEWRKERKREREEYKEEEKLKEEKDKEKRQKRRENTINIYK